MSVYVLVLGTFLCISAGADWPFGALPSGVIFYGEIHSLDGADTGFDTLLAEITGVPTEGSVSNWLAGQLGASRLQGVERRAPVGLLSVLQEDGYGRDAFVFRVTDSSSFMDTWLGAANPNITAEVAGDIFTISTPDGQYFAAVQGDYALAGRYESTIRQLAAARHNWRALFAGPRPFEGDLGFHFDVHGLRATKHWAEARADLADFSDFPMPPGGVAGLDLRTLIQEEAALGLALMEQVSALDLALDVAGDGIHIQGRTKPEPQTALATFLAAQPGGGLELFDALSTDGMMTLAMRFDPASMLVPLESMKDFLAAVTSDADKVLELNRRSLEVYEGLAAVSIDLQATGDQYLSLEQAIKVKDEAAAERIMKESIALVGEMSWFGIPTGATDALRPTIREGADSYQGTRIDRVTVPIPVLDATMEAMMGDVLGQSLTYDVAVRDKFLYAGTHDIKGLIERVEGGRRTAQSPTVAAALANSPPDKLALARIGMLDFLDMAQRFARSMPLPGMLLEGITVPNSPGLWTWLYTREGGTLYLGGILPIEEMRAFSDVVLAIQANQRKMFDPMRGTSGGELAPVEEETAPDPAP